MLDVTQRGPADVVAVDDATLLELLGADRLVERTTSVLEYDLETITTAGRWWVSGVVERDGVAEEFRLVAKVVQSADRSPVWTFVPPEGQALTLALLDWRVEPAVYGSDLSTHLPPDLAMPRCRGVRAVDEGSAVIWLDAVPHDGRSWDDTDLARAARALGRLAGSAEVAEVADRVGHPYGPRQARAYWEGRLSMQFGTAYRDPSLWEHPVLATEVPHATRDRLVGLLDAGPDLVDEIEALPLLSGHGDGCANNLLLTTGAVVAIDWAFFSRLRLGFDLSQLVISDVELGRVPASSIPHRQAVAVPAYAAGLADLGVHVEADALLRAHRVQLALAHGTAAVPLEQLSDPPTTLVPLLRERLAALDEMLTPLGL